MQSHISLSVIYLKSDKLKNKKNAVFHLMKEIATHAPSPIPYQSPTKEAENTWIQQCVTKKIQNIIFFGQESVFNYLWVWTNKFLPWNEVSQLWYRPQKNCLETSGNT